MFGKGTRLEIGGSNLIFVIERTNLILAHKSGLYLDFKL